MALAQGETEQTASFQCTWPAASGAESGAERALGCALLASDALKSSAFMAFSFFPAGLGNLREE
jgi:hypothetical protein